MKKSLFLYGLLFYLVPMSAQIPFIERAKADFITSKTQQAVATTSYCTTSLSGGNFDITSVAIAGTTLNNNASRSNMLSSSGAYYTSFAATGANTAVLTPGASYTIKVTCSSSDIISAWIDFNQNGTFDTNEWVQISASSSPGSEASAQILVPINAVLGQTGLRIRTRSVGNSNGSADACSNFGSGCTEDYTITIGQSTPKVPVADFYAVTTFGSIGGPIQFNDNSSGVPTNWKWSFQGGIPSTSTLNNPLVTYAANGLYNVKLVVSNALGTDSIVKTGYITVTDAVNMPVYGSNSVTGCGVTIYDNGGRATYSNSSDGILTIYPSTPGAAVKLQFGEFNTEQYGDYLYVYNGTSTNAPTLASLSGTTIPGAIVATNPTGALTLRFVTNYYSSFSGFVAQATCTTLSMQSVNAASWTNSVDNNQNGIAQSKTLNFTVRNEDVNSVALMAKVYSKLSSSTTYTLISTSSLMINASSNSNTQYYTVSGLPVKGIYDFKIELYNSSNTLLNTYDMTNNAILGGQSFESAADDIIPAYCTSGIGGGNFDITNVSIVGTTLQNNTTRSVIRAADGSYYTEFPPTNTNTCTLTTGSRNTISVTTQNSDNISLWIDYNHDLTFQANEWTQVTASSNYGTPATAQFYIPANAVVGQTRMRIRTVYSGSTNGSTNACSNFYYGCTEDYTITLAAPVLAKPVANFDVTSTTIPMGNSIIFNDLTTGAPASWSWSFPGGTPATSTNQYPNVMYPTPGIYSVTLKTTNSLGTDSITKVNYVNVLNSANVPATGTNSITTCNATIYDNGGTGNYANSTNGSLTIYPGTVGSAVMLQFSTFNTESCCDGLTVYNGTSTSASILGTYAGTTIPPTLRATNASGALTLRFNSDGSSASAGFAAQATCVPLTSRYLSNVSWTDNVDNNSNGYLQSSKLSFTVKNDDVTASLLYANVYGMISNSGVYTLIGATPLFNVGANSMSAVQNLTISGLNTQETYEFKVELYDSSNLLLSTYDASSFSQLGALKFESMALDGDPTYCVNSINGGSFDISAVSIANTTLNNASTRQAIRTLDGSYYTLFPASPSSTCSLYTGNQYTLSVTTKASDIVSVWIDYNQDKIFQPSEWTQVATYATSGTPYPVTITVPTSALSGQTRMRIRTNSYGYLNGSSDACTSFTGGCTEDYTITIATPVMAKPVADFIGSSTNINMGSSITFSDISTGIPTSWRWSFEGGSPISSTAKSPTVVYNTAGIYAVKLVVSNTMGADSITKTAYVNVLNALIVPSSGNTSATVCGGTIYDNGGTSNYVNSTNGSITLYPSTVGSAIKLQFSEFSTEGCCDALYIYNGTTTSSPLIASYAGTTLPPVIKATNSNGALTLRFSSDGSSSYSGFAAAISCTPLVMQYVANASWTNSIDNNYNGLYQSRTLNFSVYNAATSATTLFAKIYYKLVAASTYTQHSRTVDFTVGAAGTSETLLCGISNMPTGYYDLKIELYNSQGTLISQYDSSDNTILKNQGFEPNSADGLGAYCTASLGGSSYDISQVSITGTTLNNNSVRPTTGAYASYSASGSYTGRVVAGTANTVNVLTSNNDIVSIWIDYDHSGTLDASEWSLVTSASNKALASTTVFIPSNTLIGQTRMRVRTRNAGTSNYANDACSAFTSGCTEDYILTIDAPTGINEVALKEMRVYPNPAIDVVNIVVPTFTYGKMYIMDMLGKVVVNKEVEGEHIIENISGLSNGMYIVSIQSENGVLIRKQMLIQR